MSIQKLLISGAIIVSLILGIVGVSRLGELKNLQNLASSLTTGSISGPDISSSYLDVNNVDLEFRGTGRGGMIQASTTACVLRSPTDATSTLVTGTVNFAVSSTTASTVTIAKSSTPFATTTLFATISVAANAMGTFPIATTSAQVAGNIANVLSDRVFAPGTYIVVSMAGGTGTFSPVGSCQAEFMKAK